jgi:hypothetical protein
MLAMVLGLSILAGLRETLTEQVLPNALEMLLALLIPALFAYVRYLIVTKVQNERTAAVLLRIEAAAVRAVKATQQTFVEAIALARADGKVTDAEWAAAGAEAKRRALRALQGELGEAFMREAEATLKQPTGGVLKIAETFVEAAVHDRKLSVAAVLSGAVDFVKDAMDGDGKPHHPNAPLPRPRFPGLGRDPLARR